MTADDKPVVLHSLAELPPMTFWQSPSGNIHSPWFSLPKVSPIRETEIMRVNAKTAFATALSISPYDVMTSTRENMSDFTVEFRLSTRRPFPLPKPKPATKIHLPGAIDI